MAGKTKKIALIGANKEGLKLLPVLLKDSKSAVCVIADPNREAMLFKLRELGYRLSSDLHIDVTSNLEDIKRVEGLDIIIDALQDQATERFLESPEFKDVEKLGPLSTRLLWGVRTAAPEELGDKAAEQSSLLSSLREIVDAVRLTIDRKELLSVILKLATESTDAERGSIMLVTGDEGTLRVEIAKGMDEEVVRKVRVPIGDGVSGKVAKFGKPLLVSGKANNEKFQRPMDRTDVKSAMSVPLIVNGEIIGVINVSSSESSHNFTGEDLNFLTSLAGLAAEVIQRSNEYEKLRVDAAKFSFWREADSIMSANIPLDRRLNTVAKRLAELVPGLTCFIYIYDDETDRLVLKAASIRDAKNLGALSLRLGEGVEGMSVETREDVFLVDRTEDGAVKRVYMSLPMVSHGLVVGTFNGHIVSPHGVSVYHESFLKDIRNLLASSVYKYKQGEKEKMRSRKMFAVDEAGLEMISIKDRKKLLTIIATAPAAILGAEGSLLRIRHDDLKRYQTAATFGLDDRNIREYFLPLERETVMEVFRKRETVAREFSEEASPYVRSVLSRPLIVNGSIAGVLTFFNKTADGSVFPSRFSKSDVEILDRFCVYAEKSLVNILTAKPEPPAEPYEEDRRLSPREVLERRVEEELNRARRFDKNMVLVTIRLAGLKGVGLRNRAAFEERLVNFVRKRTRSFDIIVRLDEETFGFLFLDTNERITRLFSAISEVTSTEDLLARAVADGRVEVLYGYATFPRDGDSFSSLFARASERVKLDIDSVYDANL